MVLSYSTNLRSAQDQRAMWVIPLRRLSGQPCQSASNLSLNFWQENIHIESVPSHIKSLSLCEQQGNHNEFDFLQFIEENALKPERLFIVMKKDLTYSERQVVVVKLMDLSYANLASRDCKCLHIWTPQICLMMIPFTASVLKRALVAQDFDRTASVLFAVSIPVHTSLVWAEFCWIEF